MKKVMDREVVLKKIFDFLEEIQLPFTLNEIGDDTFLPGIQIKKGVLQVDLKKLKYPGDLLHEAGHIAVSHFANRESLNGNIIENNSEKAGDEMAVLLWSFAAAQKIGLETEVVFHDKGYRGEAKWLREQFEGGKYIGLPLLQWMGFTDIEGEFAFPKMKTWLRE